MSELTELQTIASNIRARLAEITAKPKPTYEIEGQEVRWQEYFDSLTKNLKAINEQIAGCDPYAEETQGFT